MADPTTILTALQGTIVGTTQSVKNAEQVLSSLQNDPNFLPNLLLIIKQQSVSQNIRKAAAIYTKKYAKSLLEEVENERRKQKIKELTKTPPKVQAFVEQIINQLANTSIDMMIRKYFVSTIQHLLVNNSRCLVRQFLDPICTQLLEAAKTQQDSKVNFQFLGFLVQALMCSFSSSVSKQQNIFMQNTIITFCHLNLRVFKYTADILEKQDKQKIIYIFRILKLYSYTIKAYFKKLLIAELQSVKVLYDDVITLLISTSLDFMLKNNQLQTQIIFFNSQADSEVVELFHSIKADYVQSSALIMRCVFVQFRDAKMVTAHGILNSPSLIPSMINALNQILSRVPYFKIKSPSLVKLAEQILSLLITAVRNMFYYKQFHQYKTTIVQGIIIKILRFSPKDCQNLVQQPDQFISQLIQTMQIESKNRSQQIALIDKYDQIEQYSNLRTLTASLLSSFCKHIDGSLPQVLSFSLNVLKTQQTDQFLKPLFLMMLCILREQIVTRQDQAKQIIPIITSLLRTRSLPKKIDINENTPSNLFEENIEYLMLLLTLFRYLSKVPQVEDTDIQIIYELVAQLIVTHATSQAHQFAAFDLVISLCDRKDQLQPKFVEILVNLVAHNDVNILKCLQTLSVIINTTNSSLAQFTQLILTTISILVKVVNLQVQKPPPVNQLLINKSFSVITHICQNQSFIPRLIPQIEEAIMPLLVYIDGKNNYDFQEDILMMMSSFIQKSKSVSQSQLAMFEIIPKLFYSQYDHMFGHSFQTLQIFIFYGNTILSSAPQAINAIIQMAITNMNTIQIKKSKRNEAQNCDGVLIIQSLILSCGNAFTNQNWIQITTAMSKRLQNPPVKTHILQSNILATIALVLTIGYKAFSVEDCDILLNRVIQNHYCFVVQYSIKLAIISFTQLLGLFHLPFIVNRFTILLDTTLTLLQSYQKKQMFSKNLITQQQRDYDISVTTIYNSVKNIDEVEYFKKKINQIRQKNVNILQKAIAQLPEKKAEQFSKTMNMTKIHNEKRQIFKIKK